MFYTFFKNKNIILQKSNVSNNIETFDNEELNIYYHIYSNILNHEFPVSKLGKTLLFYELIEIMPYIQINHFKYINICDFSKTDCFKQFLEYKITNYAYHQLDYNTLSKFDLLFFNLKSENVFYVISIICKCQYSNGTTVIRLNNKNNEFIYLLTTLFTKIIICRPTVMCNDIEDYYIICQKFDNTYDSMEISKDEGIFCKTPLQFTNYINEVFVLIRQQCLIYRKNLFFIKTLSTDKIETIRNKNIYNCIKWCENHNIPCNDIKTNIFNDRC